jgi:hypothetical protein
VTLCSTGRSGIPSLQCPPINNILTSVTAPFRRKTGIYHRRNVTYKSKTNSHEGLISAVFHKHSSMQQRSNATMGTWESSPSQVVRESDQDQMLSFVGRMSFMEARAESRSSSTLLLQGILYAHIFTVHTSHTASCHNWQHSPNSMHARTNL